MTRKDAIKTERELKARGVYKPHVSQDGSTFLFESWPLEARVSGIFDSALGPMMNVIVVDSSLNGDKIATINLTFGQDTVSNVAPLLIRLHPESYARAKEQERAVFNQPYGRTLAA